MRKTVLAITAALLIASPAYALFKNLPHHNRSDVDDIVEKFIPFTDFSTAISGSDLVSTNSNNVVVAEVGDPVGGSGLGFSAMKMTTSGDTVSVFFPLPDNACVNCPIKIGVVWSTSETDTNGSVTFRALYQSFADGEALAAASTALDTVISSDTVDDSAYGLQESPLGEIDKDTVARLDSFNLLVDLNSASGTMDPVLTPVWIHGINLHYTRENL